MYVNAQCREIEQWVRTGVYITGFAARCEVPKARHRTLTLLGKHSFVLGQFEWVVLFCQGSCDGDSLLKLLLLRCVRRLKADHNVCWGTHTYSIIDLSILLICWIQLLMFILVLIHSSVILKHLVKTISLWCKRT